MIPGTFYLKYKQAKQGRFAVMRGCYLLVNNMFIRGLFNPVGQVTFEESITCYTLHDTKLNYSKYKCTYILLKLISILIKSNYS